jgi:hypothetical protein
MISLSISGPGRQTLGELTSSVRLSDHPKPAQMFFLTALAEVIFG